MSTSPGRFIFWSALLETMKIYLYYVFEIKQTIQGPFIVVTSREFVLLEN